MALAGCSTAALRCWRPRRRPRAYSGLARALLRSVVHRADPTPLTGAVAALVLTVAAVAVAVALTAPVLAESYRRAARLDDDGSSRSSAAPPSRCVRTARLAGQDRGLRSPAPGTGRAWPRGAARARARPPAGRHHLSLPWRTWPPRPTRSCAARPHGGPLDRRALGRRACRPGHRDRRLVAVNTVSGHDGHPPPGGQRPPSAWSGRIPAGSVAGPGQCPPGGCSSARRRSRAPLMAAAVLVVARRRALQAAGPARTA